MQSAVIDVLNVFLNLPFNNVKLTSLSFLLSSLQEDYLSLQDKQTKQVNFIKTSRLKTSFTIDYFASIK